ncbi:MAG: DNA-processing protein DprA [Candidatus Cloacimonetes bacterium]|nr:DNA-processing protein DprA [Candidatus Cloacimonadota bacterium]
MIEQIKAWLIFRDDKRVRLIDKHRIIEKWGEPANFIGKPHLDLKESGFIPRKVAQEWENADLSFDTHIDKAFSLTDIKFISLLDEKYPLQLKSVYCPPLFLFYRGDLDISSNAVAIIGTRKISNYGVRVVNSFVKEFVEHDLSIVSGLSFGVDAEAHRCTLNSEGKTIAILPGALDKVYPDSNRDLADKIAETGLLLSEYPPGQKVERWHFPERNRIISGISKAVIMVEGGEKSGALITARFALEQDRLLFAVPGDITRDNSKAPNKLIAQGAIPALSPQSVLEELGIEIHPEMSQNIPNAMENNPLYALIAQSAEPLDMDTLIEVTNQNFGELAANLLELEMDGLIRRIAGGRYTAIL